MEAGREADFHEFVITRSAALFRTAYLLTGDRHAAEDLVQSALAKTASRLRGLRDPAALEGYVRRSMYHEQTSRWRRRSRGVEVATERVPEQFHEGHSDAADLRLVMRAALARLTPRQRTVLVLRYFEDLSETEIARVIGVRVGSVRSQVYRSLDRLKKIAPELSGMREFR
ncbi:SigE family RNA polymerase sigma factor [Nonomuraea guangzhouensis]|uniref:SigE family RNA polymerase sigma factor n=1 Tax=Nonomuraea guangzhouensis TaxID=1291555 RepID=A0ABW4G6N7_9ACTN|nr:SigE family RNA polymerase sigma factor [Nonomuraea guangzhouensis]